MNPQDLLSAALDNAGIDRAQTNEQSSTQPSTSNVSQPKHTSSDIKPFILNGQVYYRTPRGVVQFKQDNKIVMVSEYEVMIAKQAEEARKLIQLHNMGGLQNLGQLMNSGMSLAQWHNSVNNPMNNPMQNSQLAYLSNPATSNNRASNNFLISNHVKVFGQTPDLNAELQTFLTHQGQSLFDASSANQNHAIAQATRSGRNNFESIFQEVAADKEIDEDDEQFQAETYAEYMPSKLKLGLKHPDSVVETSSLSSVLPPNINYVLSIGEEIYDSCKLSALQLESIIYASQQHEQMLPDGETRCGFLIGDGAGVGKGRTVAGIILENYLKGRKKAIWLSVSTDLKIDAERDLHDIGAKINLYALNKLKYGKIRDANGKKIKKGIIFSTYSSLISESSTVSGRCSSRLGQLIDWFGEDNDGVIIFDECHKAKNLVALDQKGARTKSTKTGMKVLELQTLLPQARIVYASATGATEPRNMSYMVRLGIWGPGTGFECFEEFQKAVDRRGVGAMELVAMDMKQRGMYIARQLSFKGVTFEIQNIKLSDQFVKLYDDCVDLWADARDYFEQSLLCMTDDNATRRHVMGQFWSAHQRFFKYLCIAAKVPAIVERTRQEIKNGNTVVIGLQSTGESKTLEALEESGNDGLTDFVSTAKAVFQSLVEKHFPAPNRKKSLALLKNYIIKDDGDYTNRSTRRARQETQSRLKKSSKPKKSFINDDSDETEIDSETEDDESIRQDDASSDDNFSLSDEEDERKKKKGKRAGGRKTKSDDESLESSLVESNDSENYSSEHSDSVVDTPVSDSDVSIDSDDSEDLWDAYARKRSKNDDTGKKKQKKNKRDKADFGSDKAAEECDRRKEEMLRRIDKLGERLPPNTIDELIKQLGGSTVVAEMTGRKGRLVMDENDKVIYQARNEDTSLEMMNIEEKNKFMNGDKEIAIISEAASSGISLHSDRRVNNLKRRVHITIELPWAADRAIQQFGRTHRSNQVNAPKYIFMISELAGEQRFASAVAKRLESLGALTHGDRRATQTRDLSRFNIDPKYSKEALETVMNVVQGLENSPIEFPGNVQGETLLGAIRSSMVAVGLLTYNKYLNVYTPDKDHVQINRFLNRILGMKVSIQNTLFGYFTEVMDTYIRFAKRSGTYDQGIMVLSSDQGQVERLDHKSFKHRHSATVTTTIDLHKVAVERGISWERAMALYEQSDDTDDHSGFYKLWSSNYVRTNVILAIKEERQANYSKNQYRVYKANIGVQKKTETLSELRARGTKIDKSKAQSLWTTIYDLSERMCNHMLYFNNCKTTARKIECNDGKRKQMYFVLTGSILPIWTTIENILPESKSKLQIVRLNSSGGLRCVGIIIPAFAIKSLLEILEKKDEISRAPTVELAKKLEENAPNLRTLDDEATDFSDDLDVILE